MISLSHYISGLHAFSELEALSPWMATSQAAALITNKISGLNAEYKIFNNVAIHQSAEIDARHVEPLEL